MLQVGSGAESFLAERAERTARVRTQHVGGAFLSTPSTQSTADISNIDSLREARRTPDHARMWAPSDFVPAHLQTAADFWSEEILLETVESDRATLLSWVNGVNLHDFIDESSKGVFQGRTYDGSEITAIHLQNHVPDEHKSWVTSEVAALAAKGCIAKWRDVADIATHPKPHLVLPFGVEPKKPRLIWDA